MHLADAIRSLGIAVGDVVEVGMAPGWLSGLISEAISETPAWREGLLIEITAVGEQHVLGFALQGAGSVGDGKAYKDCEWERILSPIRNKERDKKTQDLADAAAVATDVGDQNLADELADQAEKLDEPFLAGQPFERLFTEGATVRKVGSKVGTGYVWTMPNLVNIYTRCQEQK